MMTLRLLEEASGWRFEKPKMMILVPERVGQRQMKDILLVSSFLGEICYSSELNNRE